MIDIAERKHKLYLLNKHDLMKASESRKEMMIKRGRKLKRWILLMVQAKYITTLLRCTSIFEIFEFLNV